MFAQMLADHRVMSSAFLAVQSRSTQYLSDKSGNQARMIGTHVGEQRGEQRFIGDPLIEHLSQLLEGFTPTGPFVEGWHRRLRAHEAFAVTVVICS
jgi:hypothetical protein